MDRLTEDAELIASELASNAVAASTGTDGQPTYISGHMPVVRVCLLTDGVRTLLKVWDQAPGIPVIRDAAGCEESGRGLVLIDAIADKWGWSPATGRPGKVVWAEISLLP
jgi:anti-sigma regulatory factor (Ser/Thr protein kinase)